MSYREYTMKQIIDAFKDDPKFDEVLFEFWNGDISGAVLRDILEDKFASRRQEDKQTRDV